jgi:FlaA1/EpsC-like NDP-sugar epimerase
MRPGEKEHEPLLTKEESAYLSERDGMYVIHNPVHLQYGAKLPINKKQYNYYSETTPHLSKSEIRKILYDKKII